MHIRLYLCKYKTAISLILCAFYSIQVKVIPTSDDVEIIVVAITSDCPVSVSYSVDVLLLSDAVFDVLSESLAAVIIAIVTDIGVDVLTDVKANIFEAARTDVEFVMPTAL